MNNEPANHRARVAKVEPLHLLCLILICVWASVIRLVHRLIACGLLAVLRSLEQRVCDCPALHAREAQMRRLLWKPISFPRIGRPRGRAEWG